MRKILLPFLLLLLVSGTILVGIFSTWWFALATFLTSLGLLNLIGVLLVRRRH